jgi:plastocyanin domain-containing protein
MTMLQALRRSRQVSATRIRVRGGYHPDTVHARIGEPVRLIFRREETAPCSERVVFPDFGKSAMLPAHEDVTIELAPERSGRYEFTCQMGMLRGTLIVAGDTAEQPSARAQLGSDR